MVKDSRLIRKALKIALFFHGDNMRKDGLLPEVTHPIDVMKIAHKAGVKDVNILCACLLHDTVEDTYCTIEYLEKELTPKIAEIVKAMTDDKTLSKLERKKEQVERAKTYYYETCIVRMCDKLSNVSDRLNNPIGGEAGYIRWCNEVVKEIQTNDHATGGVFYTLYKQWKELYQEMQIKYGEQELEEYYEILKNKQK